MSVWSYFAAFGGLQRGLTVAIVILMEMACSFHRGNNDFATHVARKNDGENQGSISDAFATGSSYSFFIRNPDDILSATHGGELALPKVPDIIQRLPAEALKSSLILTARLRSREGKVVGTASQLEYFNAFEREGRSLTHTAWTVQIPNQGTLFLYTNEYISPAFQAMLAKVIESEEEWRGLIDTQTSDGPRADGSGIIIGGTGVFKGALGAFREYNRFTSYSLEGGLVGLVRLEIDFGDRKN